MSPEDFAKTIKQKYPQYEGVDDLELTKRIVAKYPVYASRVQMPQDETAAPDTTVAPAPEKNLGDLTAEGYQAAGNKITESVTRAADRAQTDIAEGKAARAAGDTGGVIKHGAEFVGHLAEGGLGTAAGAVEGIFAPLTAALKKVIPQRTDSGDVDFKIAQDQGIIAKPGEVQQGAEEQRNASLKAWADKHPDAARNLMDAFTVGTAGAGGAEGVLGEGAAGMTVGEGVQALKQPVVDVVQGVKTGAKVATDAVSAAADRFTPAVDSVKNFVDTRRTSNIDPRAKTAAERIQTSAPLEGAGAAKQRDITKTYDEFYNQEEKFKKDIKENTALGVVGGRIGDEFDKVIKLRQEAGKTMGDELKKIGKVTTNISKSTENFLTKLKDEEGLVKTQEGLTSTANQSRMTAEDRDLLNKYTDDLAELGPTPTVADLDAFMKRVPQELDVAKAAKNITSTTNGERLVKQNLRELREQFNPETSGNGALTTYYNARKAYSDLSDFVEEGQKYLGGKSQGDNYVRDASVAKSAVQSILNSGKKDWLIALEGLTGYPALDESVLALQAMKDAGNFRGLSLLETMAGDANKTPNIPLSKSGMIGRLLEWGSAKAGKMILGTPNERTRAFLESLKRKK